jgi:predicted XRE-type DNA-binding protein
MSEVRRHTRSSGNVFADLGLEHPDVRMTKAKLARQIASYIEMRGLTQKQAAEALGIDQPKVSAISRGRLGGFSIERLMHFLTRLDLDVTIIVAPKLVGRPMAQIDVYSEVEPLATSLRTKVGRG